ncbi:MAG: UDP-N-acetylmuramoyl-L-alanine--D-glutamate ligase, partial [Armatimonadota bacterium]
MTNRYSFEGLRVAVLGMGVSGLSAALTLRKMGAKPTVYDQKPSDNPEVVRVSDQLLRDDIESISGWHGRLEEDQFDMMVVSPGFRRDHPAVRDMAGKPVLSEVELAYRIAEAPILAVTGTNGKSTTTVLLWLLMESMGKNAILCGNIAGSGYPEQPLSSAAYAARPEEFLVAEVSSYQLEFVNAFRPKVSTILNVTPDHMDRHPSFDDYFATKMRLLDRVGEGDTIVFDSDEPSVSALRLRPAMTRGAKMVTYSSSGQSVTQNEHTRRTATRLYLGDEVLELADLKVLGEHNVANIMAAWEMASAIEVPGIAGVAAMADFKGLEHRMEVVGSRGGVRFINNSMCTNPAALIASSLSVPQRQHLIVGGNT